MGRRSRCGGYVLRKPVDGQQNRDEPGVGDHPKRHTPLPCSLPRTSPGRSSSERTTCPGSERKSGRFLSEQSEHPLSEHRSRLPSEQLGRGSPGGRSAQDGVGGVVADGDLAAAGRDAGEHAAAETDRASQSVRDAFDRAERGGQQRRQQRGGNLMADVPKKLAVSITFTPGVSHRSCVQRPSRHGTGHRSWPGVRRVACPSASGRPHQGTRQDLDRIGGTARALWTTESRRSITSRRQPSRTARAQPRRRLADRTGR